MNPQYIYDNSTSPPTQSVLQYAISPDTVFVSTPTQQMYADLTITVFNPHSQAVTCQMFRFGFLVGAQYGDLTTSTTGIEASSGQGNWTISSRASVNPDHPSLNQFSAPTSGMANRQLAPNQSLIFRLKNVLINSTVGEGGAPFVITEVTGTTGNPAVVQGAININKQQPTLSATLAAIPPVPINPGDTARLSWQVPGADHWQLYDYDTETLLYDSKTDTPPQALSYGPVCPQHNTNYELVAWAGELFTTAYAEVMVALPQISAQGPLSPVDALTKVIITWTVTHANSVTLEPGDQTADASLGSGQFTVQPTQTTTYTLTALRGNYKSQPPAAVTVYVNPVLIKSFSYSPQMSLKGEKITLRWETKSAVSCSIYPTPGEVPLSGGAEVTPSGETTYILTATGQDGPKTLQKTVNPIKRRGWYLATSNGPHQETDYISAFDTSSSSSPAMRGKIWVVLANSGIVRYSNDGVSWQQAAGSAPWAGQLQGPGIYFNDTMWMLMGEGEKAVWSSKDGVNWSPHAIKTSPANQSLVRRDCGCVVFQGKIWLFGGINSTGTLTDVWSSPDGINWTQATDKAWLPRWCMGAGVFHSQMWWCGGYFGEAWYTNDGVHWQKWKGEERNPWMGSMRLYPRLESFNNELWVLGGLGAGNNYFADAWVMDQNGHWTQATDMPWKDAKRPNASVVFDRRIWLIFGPVLSGFHQKSTSTDVWFFYPG
jgi:hypothetical protein